MAEMGESPVFLPAGGVFPLCAVGRGGEGRLVGGVMGGVMMWRVAVWSFVYR